MNFLLPLLLNPTVLTWIARRLLELGGGFLLVNGHASAQDIQAGAGAIMVLSGLLWNAISSFSPHVTVAANRVPVKKLPAVTEIAVRDAVPDRPKTIFDRLLGR